MYYPIGWSRTCKVRLKAKHFSRPLSDENGPQTLDEQLLQVTSDMGRMLFSVLTNFGVRIWLAKPSVEIVSHVRDEQSLIMFGFNCSAIWRPDSSMVVVHTSKDYLLFYRVIPKSGGQEVLIQNDLNGVRRDFPEYIQNIEPIFALQLELSFSTKIHSGISSMMAADEEVVVCTRSCEMIGVNWDGTFDFNFQWSLKCGSLSDSTSGIVQDCPVSEIQYSAMIKGFALVFTNGRAAFFPLPETEMETSNDGSSSQRYALPKMQFIPEVDNAQSTSVNHRFQLLAFGLSNAEVLLCCVDAEDDLLQVAITHRLKLPASALPDAAAQVGGVCCLQWSPDGTVLATAWQHGGFALWSVFGALLSCSLLWDHGLSCSSSRFRQNAFNSLSWAAEGFQLWMLERKSQEQSQLSQLALAKSVLASNPSCISTCSEHVLLMAEDKLYLGVGVTPGSIRARIGSDEPDTEPLTPGPSQLNSSASAFDLSDSSYPDSQTEQEPYDVGNHQWVIVPLPAQYTSDNSPIRFCAMDELGQHLVIARRYGFAYYSLATRRWKLFGNETQERDFEVLGGLLWNQGYILLACYNSADSRYELRAYPQRTKLDNQFASITPVPCQVMLMAVHQNRILVLLIDGSLNVYNFEVNSDSPMISGNTNGMSYTNHSYSLNQGGPPLRFLYRAVHNVRFAPECVSCVLLTSIRSEDGAINRGSQPDSILMNVCGRLILLEPDPHILQPELSESSSLPISLQNNVHLVGYRFRNTLASGVENVWLNQQSSENVQRPHLTNALWLARGANGMSVWLPLTPFAEQQHNTSQSRAFISRRIMLPINTHIYPLAVRFKDALVLGAENDTIVCGRVEPINRPFCVVAKTSQVYLHHILRELLRRNLGIHAWEIANSCASLPYFPHSLELLLHEVLEEEATSSHAIPDPLLPRVVDFIREFPFFLETVAHCARKTELALWPHLFAVVGAPLDLYQKCVNQERFHTAASYIVVLHNLDASAGTCKAHASELLEAATVKGYSTLAKDLVRFLSAIEPSMHSSGNTSGSDPSPAQRKSVTRMESAHVPAPGQLTNPLQLQTKTATITDAATPMRIRTQSSGSTGAGKDHIPNGHVSSITNGNVVTSSSSTATDTKEASLGKSKSGSFRKSGNGALPGKVWSIGDRQVVVDDAKQRNGIPLARSVSNASSNHRTSTLTSAANSNHRQHSSSRRHSLSETNLLNASSCRLQ